MANPSLQIGNSNWAIKEDNLLGYSTAGTRFVPQPITMTRASAGTRVNSSGLVETVELLGSEEITNGDFASDLTGWTGYGTRSATGGVATIGASANSGIYQGVLTQGVRYNVTVNVTSYDGVGTAQFADNNGNNLYTITETGIQTFTFISAATSANLILRGLSNALFSVSNVSVKESTKNNLARVDYDGTASSLLVEPERTNLLTYSEDFSNAVWSEVSGGSASNPVLTNDYAISPDGTQNATRCLFDMGGGTTISDFSRLRYLNLTATNPLISIYIKSNNATTYQLNLSYGGDSVFLVDANPNEWTRVDKLTTASGSFDYRLELRGTKTSDDIADVLIWGAQAEEGSYPTSYIPTDGSTVTRVQDQYSKTGISNLINSEEGVLFVEMAALDSDGTYRYIKLSDGTTANTVQIRYSNVSNNIQALVYSSSALQAFTSYTPTDTTSFHKIAIKYKENDFALWVDGTEIGTDTSGTTALNLSSLVFTNFFGKVKQLQVFKTALTDSELATLTT